MLNGFMHSLMEIRGIAPARALRNVLSAVCLLLLVGCQTTPPLPERLSADAFLPADQLVLQFKTTSKGDLQPTFETWAAQFLEMETPTVAMTNQDDELLLYTLKEDGLYALYPQANTLTLILPKDIAPGMSWTDTEGVVSKFVRPFYYQAPNGEPCISIEIQITYPPTSTDQAKATQTEYYAQGLGLIKVDYNDPKNTVKELFAIGRQ